MEQMAAEFGSMLEETLKKMTSRIKMSSESYDDDEVPQCQCHITTVF